MKLYKTSRGIVVKHNDEPYILENRDWDDFVNDDHLYDKVAALIRELKPDDRAAGFVENELEAPIQNQEIWAAGVTYYNSKMAREEESEAAGGGAFYARVYKADRPELFFKATAYRTVRPGGKVSIRKDSTWDVPEPELTVAVTSAGKIVGYTLGNDMSSRSIEGENPLYLPQAKTYDGCAAVGPCIYVSREPLPEDSVIQLEIERSGLAVFEEQVEISRMKRKPEELVSYLYSECSFPFGCLLMTGTGIVPPSGFTLQKGDKISITMEPVGTLVNTVG